MSAVVIQTINSQHSKLTFAVDAPLNPNKQTIHSTAREGTENVKDPTGIPTFHAAAARETGAQGKLKRHIQSHLMHQAPLTLHIRFRSATSAATVTLNWRDLMSNFKIDLSRIKKHMDRSGLTRGTLFP